MSSQHHAAVIFDVDGPLLELTEAEEDAFFAPLEKLYGLRQLSRDWNAYKIRNDIEIYREILESHLDRPPREDEIKRLLARNSAELRDALKDGTAGVEAIPGAHELLTELQSRGGIALGIATANLRSAAQIRLQRAGMWSYVQRYPGAAENGGAKREILASVLEQLALPRERVVFLGDNLNDLDAGRSCGVHFIGFHTAHERREMLRTAGATTTAGDHDRSLELIADFLDLA